MKSCRAIPLVLLAIRFAAAPLPAQTAEDFIASAKAKSASRDKFGAIAELDRAIALMPDLASAFFQRAKARLAAINTSDLTTVDEPPPPVDNKTLFDGAMSDLGRAIALNPDFAEAYKTRADARSNMAANLAGRNDREDVMADYSSAIRAKPGYFEAYYARAMMRGSSGDQPGSKADIEQAIAINPDYIPALEMRASARRDERNFAGAIDDLDRAIAVTPPEDPATEAQFKARMPYSPTPGQSELAGLFSLRAAIKRQNDDIEGALADLDQAMTIEPRNGYNYSSRAVIRQEKGDLVGAVADYAAFKELTGDHAGTHAKVVIESSSGGKTSSAQPANPVHLYLYFALCRLQSGSAVMELKPIVAEWRDGWLKTAGLYLSGGGVSEADLLTIAAKGDAAAIARQQCGAFYYVGMRRLITGQPTEAKVFFERSLATGQKDLTEYRFARAELARLSAGH